MLKFRAFLTESKWSKYLYHATGHGPFTQDEFNPKKIKPGTHFGTLHSAMARGIETRDDTHAEEGKGLHIHAFKYHPKKGNKTITMQDNKDYTLKNKHISTDHPNWENYRKQNNITHIKYKNKVESPGSTSHVIYDPENLEHVHTFKSRKYIDRWNEGKNRKFIKKINPGFEGM